MRDDKDGAGPVGGFGNCRHGSDNARDDFVLRLAVGRRASTIGEVALPDLGMALRAFFAGEAFEAAETALSQARVEAEACDAEHRADNLGRLASTCEMA